MSDIENVEEVVKLYREYAVEQNAEDVVFIKTVYNITPIFYKNGDPMGEIRCPAYIFRIFDTERKTYVYTLVHYDPIGFVSEIEYADSVDKLESVWKESIWEECEEDD